MPLPRGADFLKSMDHGCAEILGELGLAWCRRLVGLQPLIEPRADDPELAAYLYRYASSPAEFAGAPERIEPSLIEHRDFVYRRFIRTPAEL